MRMRPTHDNELRELINDNKPVDKKQLVRRWVAFLIFFALAVTFITLGVTNIGHREEGLQSIEAPLDSEVPYYELGVSLQHWFSGDSNSIKLGVKELEELYSTAMKDAYRLLDSRKTYEGWTNLASINAALGQELTVNRELYETLRQAAELTDRGEYYSMFAGALWNEWEELRYNLEPADFDPERDPLEAERLARLSAATADRSNFSLEFLDDEACKLRFTVAESYRRLLEELEIDAPILDLNTLKEAFRLQLVADRLTGRGYDRGYLLSDSGLLLTLPKYTDGGDFRLYGLHGEEGVPAATVPILPDSCTVQLRAFGLKDEAGYYALQTEQGTLLRHPNLLPDGSFRELLLTALVQTQGRTAPESCYACLGFFAQNSPEELRAYAKSLSAPAAYLLRTSPDTLYATDPAVLPAEEYGYAVVRD